LAGAAEAALAVGPSTLPVNGRRLGYLASSAIPKHTSLFNCISNAQTADQAHNHQLQIKQNKTNQNPKPKKATTFANLFGNSTIPPPFFKKLHTNKVLSSKLALAKKLLLLLLLLLLKTNSYPSLLHLPLRDTDLLCK
jgi:hypothetical protein